MARRSLGARPVPAPKHVAPNGEESGNPIIAQDKTFPALQWPFYLPAVDELAVA